MGRIASRCRSKALSSPPFCTSEGRECKDIDPIIFSQVCLNESNHIIIKELEFRLPHMDISVIDDLAKKHPDLLIRVIHLVRDPRASFHSIADLGWFSADHTEKAKRPDTFIKSRCIETLSNIKYFLMKRKRDNERRQSKETVSRIDHFSKTYGRNSGLTNSLEMDDYMILRYEDLVTRPEEVFENLQKFTEIQFESGTQQSLMNAVNGKGDGDANKYLTGP